MNKARASAALFATGLLLLGVSPALAFQATAPGGGSRSWNSGTTFYVQDPKCDGYAAYGFVNNNAHRLDNTRGCGTTASRGYGTIVAVRACTNISLAPDLCSAWVDR